MSGGRATVIRADAMLLSELFHWGRFAVPWHQRYYDWTAFNTQELLLDIDEAIKETRRCHFLGAILLVETDEGRWEINDGQQRMVTVSLLCAALCRRFAQETGDSQREAQALRMLFCLDDRGVWSLEEAEHYEPRIDSPVGDRMRYRQMIRGNSIGADGKLTAAWRTIDEFLGPTDAGGRWERYFDFIREQLEVACLRVPRDLDPNAVYETINSRGKQLDDLDRIRNFVYSYFNADSEVQRKDTVHADLERVREVFPGAGKAAEYMRCRLQCRFGFLPKDNLYRDVAGCYSGTAGPASQATDDRGGLYLRFDTRDIEVGGFRALSSVDESDLGFELRSGIRGCVRDDEFPQEAPGVSARTTRLHNNAASRFCLAG